jgi:lipopolysaccharide biosynthesis regulator YciM
MRIHRERALEGLREIYQQEKDWLRCLEVAEQLQSRSGDPMGTEIAQYHCELAEEALKSGNSEDAERHLRQAQSASSQSVRATMLQAQMKVSGGDLEAAVDLYRRVAQQGPQFMPEILPDLLDALRRCGRTDLLPELEDLYRKCPSPALALTIADEIQHADGDDAVAAFLVDYLSRHADLAALERLLEVDGRRPDGGAPSKATRRAVRGVINHLRGRQPDYQCAHCGFVARRLHWQCPSCKHWGTIQPLPPQSMTQGTESPPNGRIA